MLFHIPENIYWGAKLYENEKLALYSSQIESLYKDNNSMFLSVDDFKKVKTIRNKYIEEASRALSNNKIYSNGFDIIVNSEDIDYLKKILITETNLQNRVIAMYNIRAITESEEEYWREKILSALSNIEKDIPSDDIKSTLMYKIYFIMKSFDEDDINKVIELRDYIMGININQEKLEQQIFLEYCDNVTDKLFLHINPDEKIEVVDKMIEERLNYINDKSWFRFNHDDLYIGNHRKIGLLFDTFMYFISRLADEYTIKYLKLFVDEINKALENKFVAFKTLTSHNEDFRLRFLFYLILYKRFTEIYNIDSKLDQYLSPVEKELVNIGISRELKLSKRISEMYNDNNKDVDLNNLGSVEIFMYNKSMMYDNIERHKKELIIN